MVTIIWLAISGGVMMADMLSTITIANFRLLRKKSGVTRPILVKNTSKWGVQKIKPEESTAARNRLM